MSLLLETESCRCKMTDRDLAAIGQSFAERQAVIAKADSDLAYAKTIHKATVEELEAVNREDLTRMRLRYEMKETELLVLRFRPDKDSLLKIRLDTGRIYEQRALQTSEKQLKLHFGKPPMYLFSGDFLTEDETPTMVANVALTREEFKRLKALGERGLVKIRPNHQQKRLAAAAGGDK